MLLLNTLHYEYEIRTTALHKTKTTQPTKEELSLALLLINKGTRKKFDLSTYKDTFVEKLKKALKTAKKTKKVVAKQAKQRKEKVRKKKTLAQSLKESLKEARA